MDLGLGWVKVGERVAFDHYVGVYGVVVEHLGEDYVRVQWSDSTVPTAHRRSSLRKVIGAARRWSCAYSATDSCPSFLGARSAPTGHDPNV